MFNLFSRNFFIELKWAHTRNKGTQCGKLRKFTLILSFGKNFVKLRFLLKKFLDSWFDEFFFQRNLISVIFSIVLNLCRENFVKSIKFARQPYPKLIWRKKLRGNINFVFSHCGTSMIISTYVLISNSLKLHPRFSTVCY